MVFIQQFAPTEKPSFRYVIVQLKSLHFHTLRTAEQNRRTIFNFLYILFNMRIARQTLSPLRR